MKAAAEVVTVALCATLGYDPEAYDLERVPGPFRGVRVTNARGPVTFIKQRDLDARLRDPAFVASFETNLAQAERQRKNHERAQRLLSPALTLAAWLATGWKVAAGR